MGRNGARRPARRGKTALVLAGGGITGAVYEIGCLRGLEDLLDLSALDFDVYVGISGGAFVASLLANGISPREMYDELLSPSRSPLGAAAVPIFRIGAKEYLTRAAQAPRVLADTLRAALAGDGRSPSELVFSLFEAFPAGLLDNSGLQEYLSKVFKSRGRSDRFTDLERELYIVGVDLDTGDAVAFGEQGHRNVSISKAVQASTALPGLYRPVRIGGKDFVDGGVKKTAHINRAIQHGAELVVCINPIVPIRNDARGPLPRFLSDKGLTYVLDQVLRIALHGRMQYGLERYANEHPEVDILVIQPLREDMRMFRYNIMRMSARQVVAQYGYRSVRASFARNRRRYLPLLRRHGIKVRPESALPHSPPPHPYRSSLARSLGSSLEQLESKLR